MVYLDTNALIRFFLKEDKQKVELVTKLFQEVDEVYIIDAVLPEVEYVLRSVYKQHRDVIITSFQFLTAQSNIILSDIARKAISLFGASSFDMVDCLLAISSRDGTLASFDKKLLNAPQVQAYWK